MTNDPIPVPGQAPPAVSPIEPTTAPAPAPAPTPAPAPAPVPGGNMFETGGITRPTWFNGINAMDVIIGSMVVASLALAILYYRKKIKNQSVEYPQIRSDVDNLKKDVEEMKTPGMQTVFG